MKNIALLRKHKTLSGSDKLQGGKNPWPLRQEMDHGNVPVSSMQTAPNPHDGSENQPSTSEKTWRPRRQGACGICKLKKIRCETRDYLG